MNVFFRFALSCHRSIDKACELAGLGCLASHLGLLFDILDVLRAETAEMLRISMDFKEVQGRRKPDSAHFEGCNCNIVAIARPAEVRIPPFHLPNELDVLST